MPQPNQTISTALWQVGYIVSCNTTFELICFCRNTRCQHLFWWLGCILVKTDEWNQTNAHWIILNFNVHSVILYNKSKEGKKNLIKISPLELKTLNSKNRCYDITIPVRRQQVDRRWRSLSELNVSTKHNPPHPTPFQKTPPNQLPLHPSLGWEASVLMLLQHRVHSREAGAAEQTN